MTPKTTAHFTLTPKTIFAKLFPEISLRDH
jgi:hypothetical protein